MPTDDVSCRTLDVDFVATASPSFGKSYTPCAVIFGHVLVSWNPKKLGVFPSWIRSGELCGPALRAIEVFLNFILALEFSIRQQLLIDTARLILLNEDESTVVLVPSDALNWRMIVRVWSPSMRNTALMR